MSLHAAESAPQHTNSKSPVDRSVYRSERPLAGWDDAAIYRRDGRNDLDSESHHVLEKFFTLPNCRRSLGDNESQQLFAEALQKDRHINLEGHADRTCA